MKNIFCISFSWSHTLCNVVIWLYYFAGAVLGMAQGTTPFTNAVPVLFVNQQPISAEEFVWFMQQERGGVFHFVKAKFNLDYGTNFWDHALSGGTPRVLLRQWTVERIVREKVQQLLFRELGLVADIRYASFVENLERLNRERESAARQGQVVYGPVRYTQLQYYEYWIAGLRLRATELLAQSWWDANDEKTRDFYERKRGKFRVGETSTLEMVTLHGGQESNSKKSEGALQATAHNIISAIKAGADMKTTAQGYDGNIKAAWRRFDEMNDGRISELFTDDEQAKKILLLAPGQSVWLPVSKSEIQIVRCIAKTAGHYPSFEEIKSRVKSIYLDQLYDQLIDESVKKADVRITPKAMESLVQ